MLVLTFAAAGAGNCAEVDGVPYVFARTKLGSFVMSARCPHRGGPLHLGEFEDGGGRLVCPWHGRRASVTRMIKASVPAVRRGNTVTVVFPCAADASHAITYRPLSVALTLVS
jgi:nitrite reductase (NADH) small subunit